ncbi:MAG: YqaA family protein [Thermodesulfobacteriota bacterium]|nr:YqaA family protein [Thermodesulfobacteriota bacterium]
MLKKLYDWVLHWAETPYGIWALFFLAFAESSFFPIPPDVLLIALAISIPDKSFRFALVCSIGSVMGGAFGYFLGLQFMEFIGQPIIAFYGAHDKFDYMQQLYNKYDAWAVAVAGFTPIPYKVFTIAAGACEINFSIFILVSLLSRSARFFIIGGLIFAFGAPIKSFIDKYFNILAIAFTVLLIMGFIAIKWVF